MTEVYDQLSLSNWSPAQEEKLVREAIQLSGMQSPNSESIKRVRDELQVAIDNCNHRLKVLTDWISRGLVIEAVSVESANGGMCRAAQRLIFSEHRLNWDKACDTAGLQSNSYILTKTIEELELGLASSNKLNVFVEALQVAVLGRESLLSRMKLLRSLFMLVPRNAAIKELVGKYERDSIQQIQSEITTAIASNDFDVMESALEAIEGLQWQSHFSAGLIKDLRDKINALQQKRINAKFSRIALACEEAMQTQDFYRLGQLQNELADACEETKEEPDDETRRRMQPAWEWLESKRNRLRVENQHGQASASLREAIDQGATWLEVEPIRAKVLECQLGIADDVEARCYTLEKEWKADKRRAHYRWIGVSCVVAIVILAGVSWIVYESLQRQLANEEAERISAMADKFEFDEARIALEALATSDPSLLSRGPLQAVQARVAEEASKYKSRRVEVLSLLDAAEQTYVDPAVTEALLRDQQRKLDEAIALSGMNQIEPGELLRAKELKKAIADKITAQREAESQIRSEAFFAIRRKSQAIPLFLDRTPADRVNVVATQAYKDQLMVLQFEIEAFKAACPVDAIERTESEVLLDRLNKDILSADQQVGRLKKFEEAWGHIIAVPVSPMTWADAARRVRDEFTDILKARGLKEVELLTAIIALQRPGDQIEKWRDQVLPRIASFSLNGAIEIPSDTVKVKEVYQLLQTYARECNESPYHTTAADWSDLASIAMKFSSYSSVGEALRDKIKKIGLVDLRQVKMKVNANTGRFVFVKEPLNGKPGILDHLVREKVDLQADVKTLRGDLILRDNASIVDGRMDVPFVQTIESLLANLGNTDMTVIQSKWLKNISEIAESTKPTDPVAKAAVALSMLRIFVEELSTCSSSPTLFCSDANQLLVRFKNVEEADWPQLAMKPNSMLTQEANTAIDGIKKLKLNKWADEISSKWKSQRKVAEPQRVVGILSIKSLDQPRKTIPSTLNGNYFLLITDPKNAGLWMLSPVKITNGTLSKGYDSIETTLIYADH